MRKFTTTASAFALAFFLLLLCFNKAAAENRHALLIGINKYIKAGSQTPKNQLSRPEMFKDLNSCINDVMAMTDVLTMRFGFAPAGITTLLDEQATGEAILSSLHSLKNKCAKGDVAFVYYSGHGSQYRNPASPEADKLDETIVPADGIFRGKDIRDKELAQIFQEYVDKGIILTVVMDACHSGSIARGTEIEYKMVMPAMDSVMDSKIYPRPENNGALILSAAQDYQMASARSYPVNNWMGNFTKAFIDVLKVNKADMPAGEFKQAIEARMKCLGFPQVPVLAANDVRRKQNLLGTTAFQDKGMVAILEKVLPGQILLLQGGMAMGIEEGSELSDAGGKFRVEISANEGLNHSRGKLIAGNPAELKAGKTFHIKKFAYSPKHKLEVAIPAIRLNRTQFFLLLNDLSKVIADKNLTVLEDVKQNPYYILYYSNSTWHLDINRSGKAANPNLIELTSRLESGKSILLQLPLYTEMNVSLNKMITDQYSCIVRTDYGNADYFISGKFSNDRLQYTVMKTLHDSSISPDYPLRSDYYEVDTLKEKITSSKICDTFYKLGKIKTWLTLEGTDGENKFPYRLFLKNNSTGEYLQNGTVKEGEEFNLILTKDKAAVQDTVSKRFVYVFNISERGDINLLFPAAKDNIENLYPVNALAAEAVLPTEGLKVGAPFGIDHILLLTTEQPVANPLLIEQEGIATRAVSQNPIDDLISQCNTRTRGINTVKTSDNWSLQKIRFTSVPK